MNDLRTSEDSPATENSGHIEAARRRVDLMRAWKPETLEPATALELESELGQPVKRQVLLAQNWRNRVYRVELENGETVLAKQGVMSTHRMLEFQHGELQALAALRISSLQIPKALGLIKEKRVLLMEFAQGETIEALMWNRERGPALRQACELAGAGLGKIELAHSKRIAPMPVAALAHDLKLAPWSLSTSQQRLLERALDYVANVKVRLGEVYYDYKAANLIFEIDKLTLIDPPDLLRHGILLWDFACFRSSMRRHLWRLSLRRPGRTRRPLIRQCLRAFEDSYLASVGQPSPDALAFAVIVELLELQRTAVLMTMQHGKVELARKRNAIAQRGRLGGHLSNRFTLPLLEIEKHWLFHRLRRLRF